jgi:predicted MFS family arabinose efflux permease
VAAVLLGLFAYIQLKVARTPLVPFSLFRSRSVSGANIVMFMVGAGFFSMWYFLSLYMQNVLGFGPLKAGLAFVPMAIGIILGAQISARLLPRFGVRPFLLAGTALITVGFVWLSRIQADSSYWVHVFGPGCTVAFAVGVLFVPLASAATAGVPFNEAGLASGVLNTARQVGGCLGLAVLATIAIDRTQSVLSAGHGSVTSGVALTSGYSRAFLVGAVLSAIGFVAAFIVPPVGPQTAPQTEVEESLDPVPYADPGMLPELA